MLNLLRFRDVADYNSFPEIAPSETISGSAAFDLYVEHTLPFLRESGGNLMFRGNGGAFLIGPEGAGWDHVMLVRHRSVEAFLGFAEHESYLSGIGHRTAALSDARLLPVVDGPP